MYIRSKLHDGNWSSWNRLVGESEYKDFVNNINNDIGQIRNTANNAESVANSAKNVADSALEKATNNETNLNNLNKLYDFVIGTGPLTSTRIPANGGTDIGFPTINTSLTANNYEVIGVVQIWLPQNKGANVMERYEFTGTKCELSVHNLTNNEIIVEPNSYQVMLKVIKKS